MSATTSVVVGSVTKVNVSGLAKKNTAKEDLNAKVIEVIQTNHIGEIASIEVGEYSSARYSNLFYKVVVAIKWDKKTPEGLKAYTTLMKKKDKIDVLANQSEPLLISLYFPPVPLPKDYIDTIPRAYEEDLEELHSPSPFMVRHRERKAARRLKEVQPAGNKA